MREKSTGGHKAINILSGISIFIAVLSFIFLIVYIAAIVSSVDGQEVDTKFGLAIVSLVLFILFLVLFAIFDIIIGIVALANKENFSSDSAWLTVLCLVGASFFFSGYIGACALIGVIVVVKQDANKVRAENKNNASASASAGVGMDKSSNVVSATVIQGAPQGAAYPTATPAAYGAPQTQYQPPQPYAPPPEQGGQTPYGYQY